MKGSAQELWKGHETLAPPKGEKLINIPQTTGGNRPAGGDTFEKDRPLDTYLIP